jgi:ribose 5-phosphate isomerase B
MKRFHLITESDARVLEIGSSVVLVPGGLVTPLARDTLKARRVTIIQEGHREEALREIDIVDPPMRTLALGADHTGVALKSALAAFLRGQGLTVHDLGTHTTDPVDYPDIAAQVARAVATREADGGIIIDGAGIGSAIAANKVNGIRAAMCPDERIARYSREHNGANVLTLGASLLSPEQAQRVVEAWLQAALREPRYIRRLSKIRRLEEDPWIRPI